MADISPQVVMQRVWGGWVGLESRGGFLRPGRLGGQGDKGNSGPPPCGDKGRRGQGDKGSYFKITFLTSAPQPLASRKSASRKSAYYNMSNNESSNS
jgi:hypothetical protein